MLDPAQLKTRWRDNVDQLAAHYQFDPQQREVAQTELRKSEEDADAWFAEKETVEKREKYLHELAEVEKTERNRAALSFESERAYARRKDLDADRKKLIEPLGARGAALREAVAKLATDDQRARLGPYVAPMTTLDWVNLSTMYGLMAMGICLIIGLFTPLAALAGAVFLGQVYLSMPPWPGLPSNPLAEGHYLIVNKNLIEMIACLAIASMPTGRWVGVDSILFGWIGRRRRIERELAAERDRELERVRERWSDQDVRVERTYRSEPVDKGPIPLA